MSSVRNGLIGALTAIVLLAGCAARGGYVESPPPLLNPSEAATIDIYRDGSAPGWFANIRVELEGREIYRVGHNEAYSFKLDPGQYLLVYRIGFNECRQIIWAEPRRTYRIRLSPTCARGD
ncbi:MAG: hypothetical protein LJE61_00230 [Thiocapsa sp.]|jgi:hypothetical protein|nr:hypothetical protein [Thiocapsa sp.]MCG6898199.1 hypothetical protein [Thiocapsa sp.]MCG6983616.1 hypothetical protein [Thiocapsa sp.]